MMDGWTEEYTVSPSLKIGDKNVLQNQKCFDAKFLCIASGMEDLPSLFKLQS